MTNDSILIKFMGLFIIYRLKNIYKLSNKILGKMSLVTGRLTFLSIWKNAVHKQLWRRSYSSSTKLLLPKHRNDPSWFIIGVMAQGESMVCFFSYFIHCFFVTIALFSRSRFVVFAIIFCFFSLFFCHYCGKYKTKGLA